MDPNLQRFLRSPTPDEWSRFRIYAQRMTRIYPPRNELLLSDDILHLVNLDRSGQPLVPKLQLLNWTTGRAFLPWLHLLLSPSLSDILVDLNGGRPTPVNVAVIKALPTTHLKNVAFSTIHADTEVDAALLDLFLKSKQLASIYVQQESSSEDTSSPDDGIEDEQEPIELENLTSIIMGFQNESTFPRSLFNRITLPNVERIYLQHSGETESSGFGDLFDCTLRSASTGTLHALRYTSHYHGMVITSARIQQLRGFSALRTIRVTSLCSTAGCKFFLSDDDISTLAVAVPNVVELYLGGTPCASTIVNVSMTSLATLAANCTKLKDLQIHFDTAGFISRALDVPSERIPAPRSASKSCQLTQLNVGTIPLSKGTDGYWIIGMALLRIFPNLKNIKYQSYGMRGWGEIGWGDVMRIIKVQRNVARLMSGTSDELTLVRVSDREPIGHFRVITQRCGSPAFVDRGCISHSCHSCAHLAGAGMDHSTSHPNNRWQSQSIPTTIYIRLLFCSTYCSKDTGGNHYRSCRDMRILPKVCMSANTAGIICGHNKAIKGRRDGGPGGRGSGLVNIRTFNVQRSTPTKPSAC